MSASLPAFSFAIPTWNGRELLARFLPSVEAEAARWRARGGAAEIVVADDGSSDGTAAWLAEAHPQVCRVASAQNRGFAPTVNAAVAAAIHPLVILLNNDVEVLPGLLEPLPRHFADPDLFAVTFRSCDLPRQPGAAPRFGTGGKLGRLRRGFWSVWDNYDVAAPRADADYPTFFVSGGFCALRRARYLELGGMDPLFAPYYWEDVDLSYRARKRGWRLAYEPAARVHHLLSATVPQHRGTFERAAITWRNRLLFHWLNLDRGELARHLVWAKLLLLQQAARGDWAYHAGWWRAVRQLGAVRRRRHLDAPRWRLRDRDLAVTPPPAAAEQRSQSR